jgi:hypothetical protein
LGYALESGVTDTLGQSKVVVVNTSGAGAVNVQDGGNILSVDDAAGSLTVDTPQLPASLTSMGNLSTALGDSPNLDAFSRLRTSDAQTVFDSSFRYGLATRRYFSGSAAGGAIAHSATAATADLTTAAQANSTAWMQSKVYHRYVPGKSQLVAMTQIIGAAVAGVVKRCGLFDASDGIFFEQNGTTDIAVVRRASTTGSVVDNRVVQASWNLDKLNGTGSSGITLDLTKTHILVIDYQWLGVGRVRIGFDINGVIIYCHQFLNANVLTVPYMRTGDLPVRWEIAGNGVATLRAVCASVASEGGWEADQGYQFGRSSGVITAASGARTHIISIRAAATINSIVNRIQIRPIQIGFLVTGNKPVLVEMIMDTGVTGGSWVANDSTYSAAEYNITGAYTASSGIVIGNFFVNAANSGSNVESSTNLKAMSRVAICLDINGANPNNFTIVATGLGGTSDCYGSIQWQEIR